MQLYVDDPAATSLGTVKEIGAARDVIIVWWQVLGIQLSFKKRVGGGGGTTPIFG